MQRINCVIIGNKSTGKTCILKSYIENKFPEDVKESKFIENYSCTVRFGYSFMNLQLCDSLSDEPQIRRKLYLNTDVLLLCFSIDNPTAFDQITNVWSKELNSYARNIPIILVGTKIDLRTDKDTLIYLKKSNLKPITRSQGLEKAREIQAATYLECSSLMSSGIKQLFDECVYVATTPLIKFKQNQNCIIL